MPLTPDRSIWESGAGWAVAILILAITVAREIRGRHRPRRILFREVARTTLGRFQEEAGDRITVRFDRKQVKSLAQLETELINAGPEEIKDIELTIRFEEHTRILDVSATAVPEVAGYTITKVDVAPNAVTLRIPYLNSFALFRQKIRAVFVCNGSLDHVQISGGGAGWSVKSQHAASRESLKEGSRRLGIAALVCGLLAIPFFVAASLNNERSKIGNQIVAIVLHSQELKQKGLPRESPELRAAEGQLAELLEQQASSTSKSFLYGSVGSFLAAGSLFLFVYGIPIPGLSFRSRVEDAPGNPPSPPGKPAKREKPRPEDQPADGDARETPAPTTQQNV